MRTAASSLLLLLLSGCTSTPLGGDGSTGNDASLAADLSAVADGPAADLASVKQDIANPPTDFAQRPADLSHPQPDLAHAPVDLASSPDLAGIVCGGLAGRPCPTGMFCELPAGQCCCDRQGTCAPLPQACPSVYDPVCGCDGMTYSNDCYRQGAGATLDHKGACGFSCGKSTCALSQVCFQGCCGAAGCVPPAPICQAPPAGCGPIPTCACIAQSATQKCQDLPGGGVLITQMLGP